METPESITWSQARKISLAGLVVIALSVTIDSIIKNKQVDKAGNQTEQPAVLSTQLEGDSLVEIEIN